MLEIDGIKHAFEDVAWEDVLSDDYYALIDLSTKPWLSDWEVGRLRFVNAVVDTPRNRQVAESLLGRAGLLEVYDSAIAQAREVMDPRVSLAA